MKREKPAVSDGMVSGALAWVLHRQVAAGLSTEAARLAVTTTLMGVAYLGCFATLPGGRAHSLFFQGNFGW